MTTPGPQIARATNLSSTLGCPIVEFSTQLDSHFNNALVSISQDLTQTMMATVKQKYAKDEKYPDMTMPQDWERFFQQLRPLTDSTNYLALPNKEVKELKSLILECLKQYINIFSKEYRNKKPNYIHSWTLVYNKWLGSEPHIHHHQPMNISGIYYVKGDFGMGNGDLELLPDKNNLNSRFHYVPSPGNLILFPSTLAHSTRQYEGELRVSIAFDIWFRPLQRRAFISLEDE